MQSIIDHSSHKVSICVALYVVSAVVMYRVYQYNSVIFLIQRYNDTQFSIFMVTCMNTLEEGLLASSSN